MSDETVTTLPTVEEEKAVIKVMSVGAVREMSRAQRRYIKANQALDQYMLSEATDDAQLEQIEDKRDELLKAFRQQIMPCIVSIPRSWLVEDAPESIGWKEAEDLDWLQNHRLQKVMDIAFGREADEDAKN